jgi:hypothetical protein
MGRTERFIMKTGLKTMGIGFIVLAMIGCATLHRDEPVDIFQRTQSFKKFSFDEVWSAAMISVEEVDFMVRSAKKEIGLIHAEAITNPDPRYLSPLMNVIIREEDGRIDVNFHIELPGQRDESGKRRAFAARFFKSLKRNLR